MIKFAFYLALDGKVPQKVEIDQISSLLATGKGLSGIKSLLLGSVAERVARYANCSVLSGRASK